MGFTQFRTFLLQQVLIFTENLDLVQDEDQEDEDEDEAECHIDSCIDCSIDRLVCWPLH